MAQPMTLDQLLTQIAVLSDSIAKLQHEVDDLRSGKDRSGVRGGMFDKKTWEPEKLNKVVDFREWSEEFFEYVEQCDEQLADMLNIARDSKEPITQQGRDEAVIAKSKVLYRTMKRYVICPDARSIVVHIKDKNPYEAWRLLFVKYDPRNDHSAEALVAKINDIREWYCKKISEVPTNVTKWEDMQREHLKRTGEEALTTSSKRHKFKMMLPAEVRQFLEIQTMLQPTLTYETMKGVVMNMVQRITNLATPMDQSNSFQEPLDSFGRQPNQANTRPGKGDGKGDSKDEGRVGKGVGKGDGKLKESRTCYNCDKPGHIAKDCWRPKKMKGQGKGHNDVGRRDRGKDGKWYRKTGINSYECEDDQQDGSWSPDTDAGLAETGCFTEARGGLGSFFDDDSGFHDINCLTCRVDPDYDESDYSGEHIQMLEDKIENVDCDALEAAMDKFIFDYVESSGSDCEPLSADDHLETEAVEIEVGAEDSDDDPMQKNDAWKDHLALSGRKPSRGSATSPLRKGNPVLRMAAEVPRNNEHATTTHLKPKLAAQPEFDEKFGSPVSTDGVAQITTATGSAEKEAARRQLFGSPPGSPRSSSSSISNLRSPQELANEAMAGRLKVAKDLVEFMSPTKPLRIETPELDKVRNDVEGRKEEPEPPPGLKRSGQDGDLGTARPNTFAAFDDEIIDLSADDLARAIAKADAIIGELTAEAPVESKPDRDNNVYLDENREVIDIEGMVKDGVIKKRQGKRLRAFIRGLTEEFKCAEISKEVVEVATRRVVDLNSIFDDDGFDSLSPFGDLAVGEIQGVVNEGRWLRIKNGITVDSGSSVFVMPSGWLQMFLLTESEGSKRGQCYQAAAKNGKPILNEGQRTIRFSTMPNNNGEKRKMTCQVAAVNKILASVAGICDQGCHVLFRQDGGTIINLKDGTETHFRRHGNVYVMDAWIPNPDFVETDDEAMLFSRPSESR